MYQKNWSDLQKHNIAQSVRGYKVKSNYLGWSVAIGLFLALIWLTYTHAKQTDQKARTYYQNIQVIQPVKTSSHRVILQGE